MPPEVGTLLPTASFSCTVIVEVVLSATTEAGLALIVEVDSEGAPALTVSVAASVKPELWAVTVYTPATVELQVAVASTHEPAPVIVKCVVAVRSPSEWFVAS